jgi:hypothetical protein
MRTKNCDPIISATKYIFNRLEFNSEQRLWFIYLLSVTYHLPTTLVIWNEFPDFENIDLDRLEKWQNNNYSIIKYETDMKWNKGHLPAMVKSYQEIVNNHVNSNEYTPAMGDQHSMLYSLCQSDDLKSNYKCVESLSYQYHKFGRFTVYNYMQYLQEIFGLDIEIPSLLLGDSGSDSHTNGAAMVMNRPDLMNRVYDSKGVKKTKTGVVYTDNDRIDMANCMDGVIREISERFPDVHTNYYRVETSLCAIHKFFRVRQGRYLNYYIHRISKNVKDICNDWVDINWELVWDWESEVVGEEVHESYSTVKSDKYSELLDSGTLSGFNKFEDLINKGN